MNDKEWVLDVLDHLEAVLPQIAKSAHNKWRDPKTRPRDKRELFTAQSYIEQLQAGIDWHRKEQEIAPWEVKRRRLMPLREMIAQCLADEFTRWRDIYSIIKFEYCDRKIDEEKKLKMRELRVEQKDVDHMARGYICLTCQLPVHIYDKTNNKIPKRTKKNTCACPSGLKLRGEMDEIRSKYRAGLERKKEIETARKEKKRRLHGTE